MSAVLATLDLPATPTRPCTLSLMLGLLTGHLTAMIVVDHGVIMSTWGSGELTESVVLGPVLKVGNSRFKLLDSEVEQVRTFLARFPSPAATSSPADHEATTTVARSLDVDGGTTPPALGQAGGSLEQHQTHSEVS